MMTLKPSTMASALFCAFTTLASLSAVNTAFASTPHESIPVERPFKAEDLVSLDRLGNPTLSPDEKRVAYTMRKMDKKTLKARTHIVIQELNSTRKALMTTIDSEGNNSNPMWNKKGTGLYFTSTRNGSNQVYYYDIASTKTTQVTHFPLNVESFKVSPQDDSIAAVMEVYLDCADLACTKKKIDTPNPSSGKLYTELLYKHWDTWYEGRRNALFIAKLEHNVAQNPVRISKNLHGDVHSKPDGSNADYSYSPNGKHIAFSIRTAGREEAWSTNFDIYLSPTDGSSEPKNLTAANLAWDATPVFSPDGKTLAYTAMKRPQFEADRFHIMLMDVASGKTKEIVPTWDRSALGLSYSQDGKTLYTLADDIGQHKLFAIDIASEKVSPLSDKGSVSQFSIEGRSAVIAQAHLTQPSAIFSSSLKDAYERPHQAWKEISLANRDFASVQKPHYEQFSFKGANNETVYGYVMQPINMAPNKKYPTAFIVHGGPQSSFANNWSFRWNPFIFASQGYAVVFIDFHGSTGYGQAFTDSISQDWGGKPLEDLKKGLAAAGNQYAWIDTQNACALGASYGGYMMNWILGNWNDGFKCIVSHAGVFDTRNMAYSTEELWFTEWENGGPAYQRTQEIEKFNPINFVKQWKTPTLVTQGELDYRIPAAQSYGTFTALQRQGIESQFLVFPDENHHILKPHNSILWHNTVFAWLDKHLQSKPTQK